MTASSRGEVGTHGRVRLSAPMLMPTIAVVAMAVVAIAFLVFSGGGPSPVASGSPQSPQPRGRDKWHVTRCRPVLVTGAGAAGECGRWTLAHAIWR